jgi:hypothetical protein
MRECDPSELERIVAVAEANKAESTRAAADSRRTMRALREKAGALLADALPKLDRAGLDRLHREHDAELHRFADEAKRHTIESAAEAARRIDALVAAERAAFDALPDDPFGPDSDLLLEVDFIRSWATPANLRDSHQAPGVNWAKYAVKSGDQTLGQFHEKVSFYNVWQNPRDVAVPVDVLVRLTANGHLDCSADGMGVGAWFGWGGVCKSNVDVSARLTLWGLWADPAPLFPVDTVPVGSCSASGGFFGDSSSASISAAPAVAARGFVVPARASILIEASLAVDYGVEFGAVDVDFASQNLFQVGWAYAVVKLPQPMNVNP